MKKNTNQQRTSSRLGAKLVVSVAILAATILLSLTTAQAFTLVDQPASHLYVFAPMEPVGQRVRLNAANVFCTGVERVLFKFFDDQGRTKMEETKSVACGDVASLEFPFEEHVNFNHVYGLIAVVPNLRGGNDAQIRQTVFCQSDAGPARGGPLATSLELIGLDGAVHQTLLAAEQRSCGK